MANLSENPQWVDGIYQIETSDPVVGGPDGVSNRQAKELASRTRYLKKELEKTGSDLATHVAAADPHTQYAPKANPTFTGTPKAPTPATDSNSQQVATTAFVKSVTAALVNGAPAALDSLQELAKAIGNDPNFSATVLAELAKKLSLSGGTLTGELLLSTANALRLIYGDYGVIMRNDGSRFYLLLTNKGDKTGSYNTLRPFDINLATGDMTIGHDLNVVGLLKEKGQRVYSPNNKPTAADVGALSDAQAAQKYAQISSPGLVGKPTAPTAPQTINDTQIATTAFVKTAVAALVNGSPAALDTLQELAKALGNDPNFSTTVLNALAGKLAKDQNGADIIDKNLFVKNIGAARVFHGAINIGGDNGVWKTSDFIAWLKNQGAFNHPYWVCKGSWYFAGNKIITDTGVGNIQLAGAVIEVFGTEAALTIRITTPSAINAAGAIPNAQFIYINHGDNYSPGWRRDYNTRNLPTAADVRALSISGGTLTGRLTISDSVAGEALLLGTNSTTEPLYIRGQKNGVHSWYVGKGASNSDDVMLHSYAHDTMITLKSDRIETSKPLYVGKNSVLHTGIALTDLGAVAVSELAGIPLPFPGATAPTGWLKCNGQAFDKTKYPVLAICYPAGKLPDLRGEFIRGWDDGRGVDVNRSVMSAQSAFIPPIPAEGWGRNGVYPGTIEAGRLIVGSGRGEVEETLESLNGAGNNINLSGDNRPRNIAFNYILRAA